jgi:natural product biosynthesis luciferase-like monooxygenase protein
MGDHHAAASHPSFSLFFFSDDRPRESDAYRLVLEAAKFADAHGFEAVWLPERHFNPFGALYPNPSVLAGAVSAVTEHVGIRAGSVVIPLHHPVRIAEEWAMVDNLSGGRVSIAAASGWAEIDFGLSDADYAKRRQEMFDRLDVVRRLWRGESTPGRTGRDGTTPEVRSYPRPVQPELPVWITTVGTAQTWIQAGELGCNILTALVGTTLEEITGLIRRYREARARHGHDPAAGRVTAMIHTFLGDDVEEVRSTVREPMISYLLTHMNQNAATAESYGLSPEALREAQTQMAAFAFERYFQSTGLFGTVQTGLATVARLAEAGIDEIACLIDFGVEDEAVLGGLARIEELSRAVTGQPAAHPGSLA